MIPALVPALLLRSATARRVAAGAGVMALVTAGAWGYLRHRDGEAFARGARAEAARLAPVIVQAHERAALAIGAERQASRAREDSLRRSAAEAHDALARGLARTAAVRAQLPGLSVTPAASSLDSLADLVTVTVASDQRSYQWPRRAGELLVWYDGQLKGALATIDTAVIAVKRQASLIEQQATTIRLDSAMLAVKDATIADLSRRVAIPERERTRTTWRLVKWAGGAVAVAATVAVLR